MYAKTITELESMVESLLIELKIIGLDPNAAKTKILTSNELYMSNTSFIDIDGEFIDVVQSDAGHKYLGQMLSLNAQSYLIRSCILKALCLVSISQTQTIVGES